MLIPWKSTSPEIGVNIEQQALYWLTQQGLTLITQNYRCKTGEIDIIMNTPKQLVFVEVRYRSHPKFGSALESVNRQKQRKLLQTAAMFLANNPEHANQSCRFDVLAAQPDKNKGSLHWTWVKDAFTH